MIVPIAVAAGLVIVGDDGNDGRRAVDGDRLRQPEVEHLHGPVVSNLDVRRLEVAVDDALRVRGFERLGNLPRDRQRLVERDRTARDAIGERRSFDHLEHERRQMIGRLEAVDGRDVGMIERRQEIGFAREARQALGIAGEERRQNLERDVARQLAVAGAVDFAHPAGADQGDDLVGAEAGAGRQTHRSLEIIRSAKLMSYVRRSPASRLSPVFCLLSLTYTRSSTTLMP